MMATPEPPYMMSPCEADDTVLINSSLLTPSSPSGPQIHPLANQTSFISHMTNNGTLGCEPTNNYSNTSRSFSVPAMPKSALYGFEQPYSAPANSHFPQEQTISSLSQEYYGDNSFDYAMPGKFSSMYANSQSSSSSLPIMESGNAFVPGAKDVYRLNMESTPDLLNYPGNNNFPSGDLFNNIEEIIETGSLDSAIEYGNSTPTPNQPSIMRIRPFQETSYEVTNPNTPNINESNTPNFSDVSMFSILTGPVPPVAGSPLSDDSMILPAKAITRPSSLLQNNKVTKKPSLARLKSKRSIPQMHLNQGLNTPTSENSARMSPLCTKFKGMTTKGAAASLGIQPNYANSPTAGNGNFPIMCVFRHNSDGTNFPYSPNEITSSKYKFDSIVERKKSRGVGGKNEGTSSNDETSDERSSESGETSVPVKKKYTRRRLLPRSKNGCWICRIKHLKCDETRPVCASCFKFGIECDYNPVKPDYVTDKNLRKQKLIEITNTRKKQASIRGGSKKKKSKGGD